MEKLVELLKSMDVPELRLAKLESPDETQVRWSLGWFNRNLAIRNSNHPNFQKAINIIKEKVQK